ILNEAYVKARYSEHFEISDEALAWLIGQTEKLQSAVEATCGERLLQLEAKVR
ncbi:MAG: nucleotidyltransferase, partial [Rhizobium sp.]|nr:nucleotidyltransferase [Rhizobium sp.]